MKTTRHPHETSALIAGVAAFVTWGLVPVYWKLLRFIPATEILAHRFVWTCVFMILLLSWQRRWPEVLANLRSYRTALFCAGSGIAASSHLFTETFEEKGELVRVLPDWSLPEVTGWAVFPGRRLMPAKTRVFLDMMEESCCDEARKRF